jgi:nucleoside-diphosphate-sugar epimerase
MVIGNGDIASILPDSEDKLYFASGVSNSSETRESEYQREKDLLLEQSKKRHIIYFSSIAVLYANSRYFKHKREMEELVKTFPRYTIVRLGNIIWGNNKNTLINSFREKIKNGENIEIRNEYRYIVDKDEFLHWINLIPKFNCEINITGQRMKVLEVVKKYV